MWDAAAYIANPPSPPTPNPGDVLLADTFDTGVLGDPLTQSGIFAPVGYTTLGNDVGTGVGALELNVFGEFGSAAASPIMDLGTPEIAAAGGYMVTLSGVDAVVGGDGTDSDWMAISLLRDLAGGSDPYVLTAPYGLLLRDTGEVTGFTSGIQFFQQLMDPAPPNQYDLRYVVEYQQDTGFGDARVSTYFSVPEEQNTIYSHDFSGTGGPLNGATVDVGGAVWQAGSAFRDDGAVDMVVAGSANGQAAFLPFTPISGRAYTLSVEIENQFSDWIACGFLPATPPGGDWTATDFSVRHSNNGAYAWVLTRNVTGDDQQGFNGPSTANGAFSGSYASTAAPVEITIILDTQAATWTAEYLLNGISRGTYNLSAAATSSIGGVGFSRDRNATSGTGGFVDNFSLTVTPGVPVPGALTWIDTTTLTGVSLATQFFTLESRNKYSTIDALEVRALVPGDINLDSVVDQLDADAVLSGLGSAGTREDGEFTLDNTVDITDFSVVQQYYGFGIGG